MINGTEDRTTTCQAAAQARAWIISAIGSSAVVSSAIGSSAFVNNAFASSARGICAIGGSARASGLIGSCAMPLPRRAPPPYSVHPHPAACSLHRPTRATHPTRHPPHTRQAERLASPTLQLEGSQNYVGGPGVSASTIRMKWSKPDCEPVTKFRIRLKEDGGEWLVRRKRGSPSSLLPCPPPSLSCRPFTPLSSLSPPMHASHSRLPFTPPIHASHSHLPFTPQDVYEGHPGGGFSRDDEIKVP